MPRARTETSGVVPTQRIMCVECFADILVDVRDASRPVCEDRDECRLRSLSMWGFQHEDPREPILSMDVMRGTLLGDSGVCMSC